MLASLDCGSPLVRATTHWTPGIPSGRAPDAALLSPTVPDIGNKADLSWCCKQGRQSGAPSAETPCAEALDIAWQPASLMRLLPLEAGRPTPQRVPIILPRAAALQGWQCATQDVMNMCSTSFLHAAARRVASRASPAASSGPRRCRGNAALVPAATSAADPSRRARRTDICRSWHGCTTGDCTRTAPHCGARVPLAHASLFTRASSPAPVPILCRTVATVTSSMLS